MIRFTAIFCLAFAALSATAVDEDIYRKKFDPPRADFLHGNMIKSGIASGLKGQDNFLTVYIAGIDNPDSKYKADGFSYTILVPAFVQILDREEAGLVISDTEVDGKPYKLIERKLDAKQISIRCLKAAYGIKETLWYRLDEAAVPEKPQLIRMTLQYDGKEFSSTEAKLKIYDELISPPAVSSEDFKFYLHGGLFFRPNRPDELATYLRKAGNNSVLLHSSHPEMIKAMKQRGFYTISQRGGSYHKLLGELEKCLSEGPAWFARHDEGQMEKTLPFADAVLWDFEPRPRKFTNLPADEWSIKEFRKAAKIADDVKLNEAIIKKSHFKEWIKFRQGQLAMAIKHWVAFCHSINPDIETIVTEGRTNRFDPEEQIDYRNYGADVTFCDPMNTNFLVSVSGLKKWMEYAPEATFLGCQNLALPSGPIFYGQDISMLQVLSSVLVGSKGNSIFPGPSMDASDFVVYNRVMGFVGRNQEIIFEGKADPENAALDSSLKKEAIHRVYSNREGSDYLAVICNWHKERSCFVMLNIDKAESDWILFDEENRQRFTLNGESAIPASALLKGIVLRVPSFDYRGFRLRRFSEEEQALRADYASVELSGIDKTSRYQSSEKTPKLSPENRLLFHLDFEHGADAVTSVGKGEAKITGAPTYAEGRKGGNSIRISDGTELSYRAFGNVDQSKGRLEIRFKTLWDGSDGESHRLLSIKPEGGLIYLAKLPNGGLVFNMVGAQGKQHYPSHKVRSIKAGEWHKVTVLWNSDFGRITLYLDGEKAADYESDIWKMLKLDDKNPKCKITIPANAGILLDDLKIYDWRDGLADEIPEEK